MTTLGTQDRPLKVAVVGAGPAGFYAAAALLKNKAGVDVRVDLFDRLPAPYGLVRYGVAPDHAKIKTVRKIYARTAQDERVRFFGDVEFGSDLTLEDLQARYDQVVFTVGAQSDRALGIPGEDLEGSYSATEFVAWYNGHPDYAERAFALDARAAVVVGAGNVALDVARILAKSVDELHPTDIAQHALDALRGSLIEDVYIVARRGPAQAKFSKKELREFGELEIAHAVVRQADFELDDASAAALESDSAARGNVEIMRSFFELDPGDKPRRVHFLFCTSPVEILGDDDGRVAGVRVVDNRLEPTDSGYIQSYPTETTHELDCGLVLRSVGYRGVALPGLPFDARRAVISNDDGRVTDADGAHLPGLYVAGWIKRGPSGVIGTNNKCASGTVACMLDDLATTPPAPSHDDDVAALLTARGVDFITFEDWLALDAEEVRRGEETGRARVKFVDRASVRQALQRSS
jgi:ferredoxin--NADP+ reductase